MAITSWNSSVWADNVSEIDNTVKNFAFTAQYETGATNPKANFHFRMTAEDQGLNVVASKATTRVLWRPLCGRTPAYRHGRPPRI